MSTIRNEMERFFQKTNMVSTYKPMFLKALLDLGDFKEHEGSQWVRDIGKNLEVNLNFVAVRFIYYCHPLFFKFKLKQQFGIMTVLSYKIFEEFEIFNAKNKVSKVEFSKDKYKDARTRLIKDGIDKTVFKLLLKDCNIYTRTKPYIFTISKENVNYLKEHKNQITKALNHELSLFLGRFNNSPDIPGKLEEVQKRPSLNKADSLENIRLAKNRCFYCDEKGTEFAQDHFVPWNYVYSTEKHNMVPACTSCNSSKHDKLATPYFLDKIIQRNKKLELSPGYSESFMKSQWENCRINYHGENEPLWKNA